MKKPYLFYLCIIIDSVVTLSENSEDGELFSSARAIESLYKKEIQINKDIELYINNLEEVLLSLKSTMKSITPDVRKEIHPNNPISATMVLKRCALDWIKITDILNRTKLIFENERLLEELSQFPKEKEMYGAMNGIFLLQETYDLDPLDFSNGIIQNKYMTPITVDIQLKIDDMEYLGKLSYNRGYYDRAVDWIMAALMKNNKNKDSSNYIRLNKTLSTLMRAHDEFLEKRGSPAGSDWRTYVTPFNERLAKKKKYKRALKKNNGNRRYKMVPILGRRLNPREKWEQFNRLCRGENLRSPSDEVQLKSFYLHHNDPYLKLGPFKVEVNNIEPSLIVIKDFIFDREGESYRNYAEDKLSRSFSLSNDGNRQVTLTRTSKQTWLFEKNLTISKIITKRIELATGLVAETLYGNEPYQVANYGLGGVYNSHMDSGGTIMPEFNELGDRVATVMAYLSDVGAGGGTTFPSLGVKVTPEKGAAVFWYNIDKNGMQDYNMFHGGCPVLTGSKWITNKWIRQLSNWKKHSCTMSYGKPLKRFEVPSNFPK
nr:prolyl 4-hydroxylase subunit alpha-2-like isoform X1 [Lepeophtheirus salmonis]XP_040583150.1 prolyl 4-hydroxylase subunit alpha-2-like isoform X1 [Lepeophtheirus salmonis]